MDQQATITAYNIPSGMGGSFTASIIEDHGDTVKVRIWYGKPTPKGWKSWGEWDGSTRVVSKSDLTGEHQHKLIRPIEEEASALFFIKPYEAEDYSPEQAFRKYICVYPDSDFIVLDEVNTEGNTIKRTPADRSALTDEQIQQAYRDQNNAFPWVMVWERNPGQRYDSAYRQIGSEGF